MVPHPAVAAVIEATSPDLEVAPLPEPTPPPWGEDGGAASEEGASAPAAESLPADDATVVDMLTGAVQVPFALAALVRGQHWELTDAEAGRIARPLARALPPAWLMSRLLAASPWAVVATATYQAIAIRLATDQALAGAATPPQEAPADDTRPGSESASRRGAADDGARADDAAGNGADRPANPSEFEGAGFGLGDPSPRPSGRRAGRSRGDAGVAPASPSS